MLKKLFLFSAIAVLLTPMAMAQQGPYTLSIGSGDGSLSYDIYSWGNIRGDTATFDPVGVDANTTIWNLCWFVYDETNDVYYFMDQGFTATTHTDNRPTDGTVNNTTTQVTNTGMGFPNTTGLTADLAVNLTSGPVTTFDWTFNNSGSVALPIRVVWFVDMDNYTDTNSYTDDYVGMTASSNNSGLAIVLSNSDGSGGLDMNEALVMDADTVPDRWVGISDSSGSSYYWSSTVNYAGIGVQDVKQIDDSLNQIVENDSDNNFVSDSANDCAGAMQWNLSVPTSGSASISAILTWGPGGSYLQVEKWNEY